MRPPNPPNSQPSQADVRRANTEAQTIVRQWHNIAEWAARATIEAIQIGALSDVTLARLRHELDVAPQSFFGPKGTNNDH